MCWGGLRRSDNFPAFLFFIRFPMIRKMFAFAGWLLLLCLVLFFCFAGGIWLGWSTVTIFIVWIVILIAGILLWGTAIWMGIFIKENKVNHFLRRFRLSRHEYVLYKLWKKGVTVLRGIQRKRAAIPWYIFMGERCGKTSLLAGAGLPMFSNDAEDYAVTPTHTMRWWFFRSVCILDLSSNFLHGTSSFQRSWNKLVGWISRGPAPAGIIVGLGIDDLMNEEVGVLHDKARKIRSQIEPLTRNLKRQLPIYILITQCDKFDGFSVWRQQLSVSQNQQALGYYWQISPDIDGKDASTLYPLFTTLRNGLDLVRLSMAGTSFSPNDRALLLDFPESFDTLKKPLQLFLASLCEPNAYFTATSLGGVWFTACEPQPSNRSRRISYFINDLLTLHLHTFSHSRDVIWQYSKKLRVSFITLVLLGCLTALGGSAVKSVDLMQGDISKLTPPELTTLLVKNESYQHSVMLYLPFIPVLNHQHERVEKSLVLKLRPRPLNFVRTVEAYKNQMMNADQNTQRKMILALAQTILTRKDMREGATLETLGQQPVIPDELNLSEAESVMTPIERLVIDRWMMQQPVGADYLKSLQDLLASLIKYDQTLAWLTAPVPFPPDVNASDFWHDLPGTVALPGIWTSQGETLINEWINLLNLASEGIFQKTVLKHFMQTLPAKRQDAWRGFLLEVIPLLQDTQPRSLSPSQLISLGEGQSPAMKFAQRIKEELDSIASGNTQPWLKELRRLQKLPSYASEHIVLQKAHQADDKFRSTLITWLFKGKVSVSGNSVAQQIDAWKKWQASLNTVAGQALNQVALSPVLTQGLFAPAVNAATSNPQIALFTSLEQLHKAFLPYSPELGMDAVWSLYRNDANSLLAHSMARSACWLNEQWQTRVMWPMSKDAATQDYDSRQTLSWQYITDFIRNSAKGLLIVTEQGPQPGEFQGQTLPLNTDFLRIARYMLNPEDMLDVPEHQNTLLVDKLAVVNDQITTLTQQQKALEAKPYRVGVISGPATIPEKARLVPIGSSLTLDCHSGSQTLSSMNFAEQAQFNWQPGQCQSVKLDVEFPNFTATYRYKGNSSWPDFLTHFVDGEALFDTSNFDEGIDLLEELNIKHVLVRFKIVNQQPLQEAWAEWNNLDEQVMALTQQQQDLKEQLQIQQPSAALRGRFSELPKDVAECN